MAEFVKICPKCGSINLGTENTHYHIWNCCLDCGYGSKTLGRKEHFFPEVSLEELEEVQNQLRIAHLKETTKKENT
ncbi:MAG: hypothetical protein H6502_04540 [Candidatus Woesearchaeota archaeon]|nr:MAG: hypothetical protein H6502_04540 [Candidatus Woesearchaeota archaeon]